MKNLTVYLVYLWTFVNIGRPQDVFPILMPLHIGVLVAALCVASFLLNSARDSYQLSGSLFELKEFKLLIALAFLMIISTPFSFYPGISINFLKEFLLKFGLYLYLVVKVITTRERVTGLLWTMVLSGLVMGVAAFLAGGYATRVSVGSTYDPNDLALLMVTMLPITIMPAFMRGKGLMRAVCIVGAVVMLLAAMKTESRGGFLGLVAITAGMLSIKISTVSRFKRIVPVILLSFIFLGFASAQYKHRLETITDQGDEGGSGRILVWKRALFIALNHPILGVGPNAFETAYGTYLDNDEFPRELSREVTGVSKWQTAHNSYLLILVELGIPGLLLFIAINLLTFKNLMVISKLDLGDSQEGSNIQMWASGLFVSLIGFNVCAFFLSQCYSTIIYVILFLSSAMLRLPSNDESEV